MLQIALLYTQNRYNGPPATAAYKVEVAVAITLAVLLFLSPLWLIFSKSIKLMYRILVHGYFKSVDYEHMAVLIHSRISFFRLLTVYEQKKFLLRVAIISGSKTFVAREGLELTRDMEILIAATQAVLTFGLDEFVFETYKCYHIFPDEFFSARLNRDVKGLTFPRTHIMLSWKSFEQGIADDKDKLNLGLHEMAHAFQQEFTNEDLYDEFNQWKEVAFAEFSKIRTDTDSGFLRDYAATNMYEFWAVCVEHFFEAPLEFKERLPVLYQKMCVILKQDMALRMAGHKSNFVPSPNQLM